MEVRRFGKRTRETVLAMLAAAAVGCNGDPINVPCPKPPDRTIPAAETVSVGAIATFAIPLSQMTSDRRLQWSSTQPTIATVFTDAGRATARAVGATVIMAIDLNSQPNCPDQWAGQLVVR